MAVRHGGRNTVGDEANTAHTKGRTGPETARGNLQILRVILTILHRDAGHCGERFGRVNLALIGANAGSIDDVDGSRQVE